MAKGEDRVDKLTDQLLGGQHVTGTSHYFRVCNDLADKYIEALATGKIAVALKLKEQIRTAVIYMNYRPMDTGMNPKDVPIKHIRWALQHPIVQPSVLSKEQRARVDSPIKGVRAFCMECQGNDTVGVRECASVNCPLWPFRMGTNAFYGKLTDAEAEMTDQQVIDEAEEDGIQEAV